jgi:hypothetical protein
MGHISGSPPPEGVTRTPLPDDDLTKASCQQAASTDGTATSPGD